MKTFNYLNMALIAVLLSVGMVACGGNDEEDESNAYGKAPSCVKAIDLGLPSGTKWANMNIGASSPEDYGEYYAWGETEEKSVYEEKTYAYYDSLSRTYLDIGKDIGGTNYDVAHVKWGGSWRLPSKKDIIELMQNCTWTNLYNHDRQGYLVTGTNGNSIFLPAAGMHTLYDEKDSLLYAGRCGFYMGSTRRFSSVEMWALMIELYSYHGYINDDEDGYGWWITSPFYQGVSVRPVSN